MSRRALSPKNPSLRHAGPRSKGVSKLMNLKVPASVSDGIERVARDLGLTKTEAVIALLNDGLE